MSSDEAEDEAEDQCGWEGRLGAAYGPVSSGEATWAGGRAEGRERPACPRSELRKHSVPCSVDSEELRVPKPLLPGYKAATSSILGDIRRK